jgi:hypothetical protein
VLVGSAEFDARGGRLQFDPEVRPAIADGKARPIEEFAAIDLEPY